MAVCAAILSGPRHLGRGWHCASPRPRFKIKAPISELEGAALATAIGSDISLFQSGSEEQPHQAVIFRPQVVSTALEQRLEALRDHGRRNDPWVLIERPRQGCTVVVTEPAQSPVEAPNGVAGDSPAVGANEGENGNIV